MPPENRQISLRPGFTLIELLTVIAIIGILAAIIIPVTGKVRAAAQSAQCKSGLRQYGTAIQMYVNDNKGLLPGPLRNFVRRNQLTESSTHLFGFLAPYISLKGQAGATLPDDYTCSGWLRQAVNPNASTVAVYVLNGSVIVREGTTGNTGTPWGYPGYPTRHTHSKIGQYNVLSQTAAITDIDAINGAGSEAPAALPPKPVHGETRNVLYFDWHVGTKPVN